MIKLLIGLFIWFLFLISIIYLFLDKQLISLLLIPILLRMSRNLINYSDKIHGVRK